MIKTIEVLESKLARKSLFLAVLLLLSSGLLNVNSGIVFNNHSFRILELTIDVIPTVHAAETSPDFRHSNDLWSNIRQDFSLPELKSSNVSRYERKFTANPESLEKTLRRGLVYLQYIYQEVKARGMPAEIALLPFVESSFNPYALSQANAAGLWQFIPATGKRFELESNWWYEGRRDIVKSTNAALQYLQSLYEIFDEDWFHALSAYNSGETKVRKAIEKNNKLNKSTNVEHLNLYRETRHYLSKLIAIRNIVAHPEKFGINLGNATVDQTFVSVEFDRQVNLRFIASNSKVSAQDLHRLNPGLKRQVTPPSGPHVLLVPRRDLAKVLNFVDSTDSHNSGTYITYVVKKGDSLSKIAHNFRLPVDAIVAANTIQSPDYIRTGSTLLIPSLFSGSGSNNFDDYLRKHEHHVRLGDSLWGIANLYNVKLSQLFEWNQIDESDYLRPDQVIVVYLD